jgi:FkbM family methyltransferase
MRSCHPTGLRCGIRRNGGPQFFSQHLEDIFALKVFFPKRLHGFFLEMGALDGVSLSTTHFFEKYRGWKGLLIEANPRLFHTLCSNRRCSTAVNAAVCSDTKIVHFVAPQNQKVEGIHGKSCNNEAIGGIVEFASARFKSLWWSSSKHRSKLTVHKVQCYPLSSILERQNITHIDLFTLDVEGGELSVLQTIDFKKVTIDIFSIETDGHNPIKDAAVSHLLQANGFIVFTVFEVNTWYVRNGSGFSTTFRTEMFPHYLHLYFEKHRIRICTS